MADGSTLKPPGMTWIIGSAQHSGRQGTARPAVAPGDARV